MRVGSNTLYWMLADHLGSTTLTVRMDGSLKAELRYKAWGDVRYTYDTMPTTFRFTGQRVEEGLGIYVMGARWYDPALARWLSADSVVPSPMNPQAFNRYSWVLNRPLLCIDPSGQRQVCSKNGTICADEEWPPAPPSRPPLLLAWVYRGPLASGVPEEGQEFGAPRYDERTGRRYAHRGTDIAVVNRKTGGDRYVAFTVLSPVTGRAHVSLSKDPLNGWVAIDQIPGQPGVSVILSHVTADQPQGATFHIVQGSRVGVAMMQGNATNDVLHLQVNVAAVATDPMNLLDLPPDAASNYYDEASGLFFRFLYVPPRRLGPCPSGSTNRACH
jgi:RHS repeat-associated protein